MCKDIPLALGSGAPALAAAGWEGRTGLSAPRAADVPLLAAADRSLRPVPVYDRLPDPRSSPGRADERSVGQEYGRKCRSRWSPYNSQTNMTTNTYETK